MKPISPADIPDKKALFIPDFVIQAFNELIVENWTGNNSIIIQDDVVARAKKTQEKQYQEKRKRNKLQGDYIVPGFDYKWLNVEPMYEAQGWKVIYDKPAYCESYHATFEFYK